MGGLRRLPHRIAQDLQEQKGDWLSYGMTALLTDCLTDCLTDLLTGLLNDGQEIVGLRRLPHGIAPEREFFIDNLLVRIHFIIVMIRSTGLAGYGWLAAAPARDAAGAAGAAAPGPPLARRGTYLH